MHREDQTKLQLRKFVTVILCCLTLQACTSLQPPLPKVVFILIDGIPADVIESVDTPAIDDVAAHGGYARAYVGGEIGGTSQSPTISAVGYNSLVTGTWANKHNVWGNDIVAPDYRYWDIFRIAKAHDPALHTALFSTWTDNRTKLIGDSLAAAGGNKLDYYFDGLELDKKRFPPDNNSDYIKKIDTHVAADASRYLLNHGPDLSWVYLQYTDDMSHRYGDSDPFYSAVRFHDELVGKIWQAVQQRSQSHAEDWLFIVTTDHGRDAKTGKNHGGQSARERTTWIATNSKRLNSRFDNKPGIVDILPSIAVHLGLTIPEAVAGQLDGEPFID